MTRAICLIFILFVSTLSYSQSLKIHSHNDYTRRVPFYEAYGQQVSSIEADIYATDDGRLLVGHTRSDLLAASTLEELYINPMVCIFEQNGGRPWRKSEQLLYWLIDFKTSPQPTFDLLVERLKRYPHVFDPSVNPFAVRIILSGSVGGGLSEKEAKTIPTWLGFDGNSADYTAKQLKNIAMISFNFDDICHWRATGTLPAADAAKIEALVKKVHAQGKFIRFWGAPDNELTWATFHRMGIDFINTDRVEECRMFFDKNL